MLQQVSFNQIRPLGSVASRRSAGTVRHFISWALVSVIAGLLAVVPVHLSAQVNTASLRGTITDSSGAAISEAKVALQNTETGVTHSTTASPTGEYSFPSLEPGTYSLEVTKEGFNKSRQADIKLEVGQVSSLNLALKVGNVSETVEVSAAASSLEVTSATLGTVVTRQEVVDLPLNGRQFTQLLELQPGTVPIDTSQINGKAPAFGAGGSSPGVNGQVNRSNIFFLDGMLASNPFFGGFSFSPSIDDIQEFKEQSHTDQAEFGESTGASVTVISRPGTNTYHGSLFEFVRNDMFDARNYFVAKKLPYHQNQFGASFGGPVIKNKLFFFANYEGGRQIQGNPQYWAVPTVAERAGNFAGVGPDGVTPLAPIYDPSTFNPVTFTETAYGPGHPFPTPDPGMLNLLNGFYPTPNFTPTTLHARNYLSTSGLIANADQGSIRVDFNASPNNIFNGRYSQNQSENNSQSNLANRFVTGFNGKNTGGNWVRTFGSSLVNQLTVSYNALNIPQAIVVPGNQVALFSSTGVGAGFPAHPGGNPLTLLPAPNLSGGGYDGFWDGAGPIGPMHILQFSDSVAKSAGKHNLKFGASYYKTWMYTNWSGDGETFSTQATWNAACQFVVVSTSPLVLNPTAQAQCPALDVNPANSTFNDVSAVAGGDPVAAMLLSLPHDAGRSLGNSGVDLRQNTLGIFAQDSWSVTPKLTVNYGLRWDYSTPMTEDHNRLGVYNIHTHQYDIVKGDVDLPSGSLPANVTVLSRRSITPQHYDWFSPRLGLAYQLSSKTTLRLGVGHAYDNWGEALQVGQQNRGSWPSGFAQNASNLPLNSAGISYISPGVPASGQNPFSVPGVVPASPFGGGGLGGQDVNWLPDSSWQWNAQVEQQVGGLGSLSVAYVGSHSIHNAVAFPYNTSLPQLNPSTESFPDTILGSPATVLLSSGHSKYNSLQVQLKRAFNNGLAYNAAFTYAKNTGLDSCGGDTDNTCTQNEYAPNADIGPTFLDVPYIFTFNTTYRLPFGKGRTYMNNGATAAILGNWQINSIVLARSGTVVNPGISPNQTNTGGGNPRPNYVSNPNSGAPHTVTNYWNVAAFAAPAPGTFGNAGLNSLRGPSFVDFDFSVFRDIPLTERMKLQFRFEAFDLFNHPNFGNPGGTFGGGGFNQIGSTFGNGTGPGGNRDIQFALKLLF